MVNARAFSALLFAFTLAAQTPESIKVHVTAVPQDRHDTDVNFGKLGNHVAVSVEVCSDVPGSFRIPTARLRQAVKMPDGYTLLPITIATTVVQAAQGRSPLASASRILSGIAAAGGAAVAVKEIPSGIASDVVLGVQGASLLVQFIFPALQTHAVQSIGSVMLPELLDLDQASNGGCTSGIVIVATPRHAKTLGTLDQDGIDVLVASAPSPSTTGVASPARSSDSLKETPKP